MKPVAAGLALALMSCAPATSTATTTAEARQSPALDQALRRLAEQAAPGILAAGVEDLQTGVVGGINLDRPMPMQSVFKLPLAAAVLAKVDTGAIRLQQKITLRETDLAPPWSPIAAEWPKRFEYTVAELIDAAVGASDNTAADVLLRLVGGPAAVTAYLKGQGIKGMRVDRTERELQPDVAGLGTFQPAWAKADSFMPAVEAVPEGQRRAAQQAYLADPRDTATPRATLDLLRKLAKGKLLSPASTAFLLDVMTKSPTGGRRLKAGLPAGATIAHKTGTSGSALGVTPAVNDVGIITMPDGRKLLVASYLSGSTADEASREAIHADVARAAI